MVVVLSDSINLNISFMDSLIDLCNDVLFYIVTAFSLALCSLVYSVILTESGMILNKVYLRLSHVLPDWLFKPLIGCGRCVSGQAAVWYSIYLLLIHSVIINIFVLIALTLFIFIILDKLYTWLTY